MFNMVRNVNSMLIAMFWKKIGKIVGYLVISRLPRGTSVKVDKVSFLRCMDQLLFNMQDISVQVF